MGFFNNIKVVAPIILLCMLFIVASRFIKRFLTIKLTFKNSSSNKDAAAINGTAEIYVNFKTVTARIKTNDNCKSLITNYVDHVYSQHTNNKVIETADRVLEKINNIIKRFFPINLSSTSLIVSLITDYLIVDDGECLIEFDYFELFDLVNPTRDNRIINEIENKIKLVFKVYRICYISIMSFIPILFILIIVIHNLSKSSRVLSLLKGIIIVLILACGFILLVVNILLKKKVETQIVLLESDVISNYINRELIKILNPETYLKQLENKIISSVGNLIPEVLKTQFSDKIKEFNESIRSVITEFNETNRKTLEETINLSLDYKKTEYANGWFVFTAGFSLFVLMCILSICFTTRKKNKYITKPIIISTLVAIVLASIIAVSTYFIIKKKNKKEQEAKNTGKTSIYYGKSLSVVSADGKFTDKHQLQWIVDMWIANHTSGVYSRTNITNHFGHISDWNVSGVTDMSLLFYEKETFDENISGWDVSNVGLWYMMFKGAESFNQNISKWNVEKSIRYLDSFDYMFEDAESFNQDISGWRVCATKIEDMFKGSGIEKQPNKHAKRSMRCI